MASPGGGGKADAVGELSGKSLEELLEILERQEKLLSNKKFLARLPDQGKKILDYTEKVKAAISQHKRLMETTGLLSAFRLDFEEKLNNVKERSEIPAVSVDKKTKAPTSLILNKTSLGGPAYLSLIENTTNLLPVATASEVEHKSSLDTKNHPLPVDSSLGTKKISDEDTSNAALPVDAVSEMGNNPNITTDGLPVVDDHKPRKIDAGSADDLIDGLKAISIKTSREDTSDASETYHHDKVTLNTFAKKSRFVGVIERREKNPARRKEKFQTNRLPSDSNCSTLNQSPGERALKLSTEERRAQDRKHLDDITAATLPPLHHSPAQLLPLEESLSLQIVQKKSYEENQAKLAAQKLLEKLNIKVAPFNPEGDSYMKYRDQNDEEGY